MEGRYMEITVTVRDVESTGRLGKQKDTIIYDGILTRSPLEFQAAQRILLNSIKTASTVVQELRGVQKGVN